MKKIFSILAISTFVLAGCVKFESDAPVVLDSVNAPAISVTSVGDYSIVATVTPAQNTDYYAFAVIPGPADELSGESLLSNAYKSAAVVSKVAKASDEAALTIEVKNLDPNSTYTIYAVANTAMGAVSEIAVETKTTTDETRPDWATYDTAVEGDVMLFALAFDDPVELTGKGHVFANFFGVNDTSKPSGEFEPIFSLEIPVETLSIDEDGWVVIPVPQEFATPGAVVAISYTEGIVKNAVGGENIAWDDIEAFVDEDGEFALDDYVIWEAYDNVNWEFVLGGVSEEDYSYSEYPEDTLVVFSDWSSFSFAIAPADEETIVAGEGDIEVVFTEGSGRKVSYTASDLYTFAQMQQYFGINATWAWIEEAPVFGATVSVKVAEGEYQDIWGNENAEFEAKDFALMSYGFTLNDVIGTYVTDGISVYGPEYNEKPSMFVISKSDNASKGNVMITQAYGYSDFKLYGIFDGNTGVVDFEPSIYGKPQIVVELQEGVWADVYIGGYNSFYNGTEKPVSFKIIESGVIGACNDYFGYYYEAFNDKEVRSNDTYLGGDYNFFRNVPVKYVGPATSSATLTKISDGFAIPEESQASVSLALPFDRKDVSFKKVSR